MHGIPLNLKKAKIILQKQCAFFALYLIEATTIKDSLIVVRQNGYLTTTEEYS
jgi:hypothetical protein